MLSKIEYQKKHQDTTSLYMEVKKVSEYLKTIGYFTNRIDSTKKINNEHFIYLNLNKKINKVIITVDEKTKNNFKESEIKENTISIPIEELQTTLLRITKNLDLKGKSFSKTQLKNILIKDTTLFAYLDISPSKKRTFDKIIIKGYEEFPTSYIKNYYNIKPTDTFNQQKLLEISDASNNLDFIKEIKSPEILFTKDSTLLYLYLKKNQNNSFDGIVAFSSKENGNLLFNGNLNIQLNNTLNTGENFNLFWNSIGEEKQELKLSTEIPYIFNSKFIPEISFSIYKQDSTFINSKFETNISYQLNLKTKLAFTYNSENSEDLKENLTNSIESYSNHFMGIQLKYRIPKNDFFFNDKLYIDVNPSIGKREINNKTTNQFKIETTISYLWSLNLRNSIYIRNKTHYLNSPSYLNNELFRIGGANSIRGYNEQSIYTNQTTFFNIEYRYLTSKKSYLYTITDIGNAKTIDSTENLLSLGMGYLFTSNNSQINLGISAGKTTLKNIDIQNTKLIINWVNYF